MSRAENDLGAQVVAVTGGARGIGRAIAAELAGAGARVAIGDLDGDECAAVATELPGEALGRELDVTDEASFVRFLDHAEQELGPLDVLVSNAGVMRVGPFDAESENAIRTMFEVNVFGVMRGMRLASERMRARGRGQLVTIASAASKVVPPGEVSYAATKHAVYAYCVGVREELRGSGVGVTIVMPGVVKTELAAGTSAGREQPLEPADVARAVAGAIIRPRHEVYVPRRIAALVRVYLGMPPRGAAALARALVPNQLAAFRQGGAAERADYERERIGEDPRP